jgi:hypothetical protein
MNTEQTAALLREAERRGLSATNCSRWPSGDTHPGCVPTGCARWPGPTGHAARPSAWSSRSVSRDRAAGAAPSAAPSPHHAKHQHQHDHDDQHPQPCRHGGLLGRRRGSSSLTLLPPTRASNSVTARRPHGPGSTARCAPARGDPAPRDLPADLGWPGGPAADHAQARRPEPLRATPSQPSPNHRPQHHTSGGPGQASPTQHDHSEPDRRVWPGRAAFALLG